MKRQTRAFLLNILTGIAIAAAAALVLLPTTASAATYYTTTSVNLREAPNGAVIGTVNRGATVDVIVCDGGWCHVNAGNGNYGYISQQFLSTTPGAGVQIGIGPNGLEFGVTIGTPGQPPIEDDEPEFVDGEACFYERTQFRGGSFCVAAGDHIPDLGGWTGDISSIENPDGLDVTVCTRTRLRGDCRTYTTSARSLGRFNDVIVSLTVD
jgi:uncharacterized protein YgiM (DUF1202 family)